MRSVLLILILTLSGCGLVSKLIHKEPQQSQDKGPQNSNTNKPQKNRAISEVVDDARISAALHIDLAALKLYKPINAKVQKGTVILTGTVESEKDSLTAYGAAWKQNGVKNVINNIKVKDKK